MKRCVLLVEDDPLHRKLYTVLLRQEGFSPVPLTNLREAILTAYRSHAVAAIIDILLPQTDGRDLIRQLRADRRTELMPILAISASPEPNIAASCLSAGANEFRPKPLPISTFSNDVRKLFRNYIAPE